MMHHDYVVFNNQLVNFNEVVFPVSTQALNYGTGVFDGIRAYKNKDGINIFRLDEHIQRFIDSCMTLGFLNIPSHNKVRDQIISLLQKNQVADDCYIRPMALKRALLPNAGFGVKLSDVSNDYTINSLGMPSLENVEGFNCIISKWRRTPNNSIPCEAKVTGGYVNSALAKEEASSFSCQDAIMLNYDGTVSEASTSNVFVIKNDKIFTPSLENNILNGVTRRTVIEICKNRLGLDIEERSLKSEELLDADEIFLTGTGLEVMPVLKINQVALVSGTNTSITKRIRRAFYRSVRGELDEYLEWLTPIYQ